jgi:hypothetical protein
LATSRSDVRSAVSRTAETEAVHLPRQPGARIEHGAGRVDHGEGSDHHDIVGGPNVRRTLDVPTPPCSPPATAPVPAPTLRASRRRFPGGSQGAPTEAGIRSLAEVATAAEVKDDGGRHDRHHVPRSRTDAHAEPRRASTSITPSGCGQAVGTTAREADGVDEVDQVARVEGVGFPRSGTTAAYVDTRDRAAGYRDDRRSGQPAAPDALGVDRRVSPAHR